MTRMMAWGMRTCRESDLAPSLFLGVGILKDRLDDRAAGSRSERWPGTVLSFGSQAAQMQGNILANATQRVHVHATVDDVIACGRTLDPPIAVVALVADVTALGRWPLPEDVPGGLVTGRDSESLADLVERTLTANSGPATAVRMIAHPMFATAFRADASEREELTALTQEAPGLLIIQSHGRESCIHLPDAVICGRSEALGNPGMAIQAPVLEQEDCRNCCPASKGRGVSGKTWTSPPEYRRAGSPES